MCELPSASAETEHISALLFFFQAEDGIRDLTVTGVQTCALPIWRPRSATASALGKTPRTTSGLTRRSRSRPRTRETELPASAAGTTRRPALPSRRSEERRVGKGVDLGGRRIIKKKNETMETHVRG